MPRMRDTGHGGGLRKPPTRISEAEVPIQYVRRLSLSVTEHMSIAKYCTPSQQSTRKLHPSLREGATPWLMMLNPDMSLGQKSTRDDVLLRSLEIAGLPRGDW